MASRETIEAVSATLRAAFPVWGKTLDPGFKGSIEARRAWANEMFRHSDKVIMAASERLLRRHKGPYLTIADFVEAARVVKFDAKYDTPAQISGANPDAITLDEFIARNPSLADAAKKFRAIAGRTLDDVTGEA